MTSSRIKYFRPQILVTFLVALGLLCAGMRVPDLSSPHRPKPTQRTILETQHKTHKTLSNHLKQHDDFAAVLPKLLVSNNTVSYRSGSHVVPPLYVSPLFAPNSGRSPPAPQG